MYSEIATIEVQTHPNADALEIAKVKGWQCVIRKGEFAHGDRVIYVKIDTLLPSRVFDPVKYPYMTFNKRNTFGEDCHLLRTIRLRGEVSQGLLVAIPEGCTTDDSDDIDALLGIERYEPPVPKELQGDQVHEPSNFMKYTKIANGNDFPDAFIGNDVVITEKLHGCLWASTRIDMADHTKMKIRDLVQTNAVGKFVMGMNEWGQVVPTRITRVYDNGKTKEWLKVRGTRHKAGKGNHFFSVVCTPNHRFWVPERGYVAASDLKPGDKTLLLRTDIALTPVQKQVILGKVLGDACIVRYEGGTAGIQFRHKCEHAEYVSWTCRGLGEVASGSFGAATSGYGTNMIVAQSIPGYDIAEYLSGFHRDGKKIVPEWVADEIGPIAFAFWYMDDGSLGHGNDGSDDKANFAVCGFTVDDCKVLLRGLAKFGITGTCYVSEGYPRIRLNAEDAERFFLLVAPYIPPVMQYKLPERYRGHAGWLPSPKSAYKPSAVEQEIIEVSPFHPDNRTRYDLETETHNFFANGVLVHNSNFRVGLVRKADEIVYMVGSHSTARDPAGENIYSRMARVLFPEDKVREFAALMEWDGAENFIIFGEVVGAKIQDLTYGLTTQDVRIFDVAMNGSYCPFNSDTSGVAAAASFFGVQTVPILETIENLQSVSQILKHRDGLSTLARHVREGVVVRTTPESKIRDGRNLRRGVLKFISPDYLLRKNATDGH